MGQIPTMLSINDASAMCGLTPYRVRQLALDGSVHSFRAGRKIYVNAASLANFLNGETVQEMETNIPAIRKISV